MSGIVGKPAGQSRPLGVAGSKALDPNTFGSVLGLATWLMSMSKDHRDLPGCIEMSWEDCRNFHIAICGWAGG